MWAIPTGAGWLFKKKNQVMSLSPESRVPETGSDPPIGSDRDSGRDRIALPLSGMWMVFTQAWAQAMAARNSLFFWHLD